MILVNGQTLGFVSLSKVICERTLNSTCTLADAIQDKTVSVKEVVQAHIAQINAVNLCRTSWSGILSKIATISRCISYDKEVKSEF